MRQQVEFEVNVHAETEITKILQMLHKMQLKMGIDHQDAELEGMKENIDLQQLQQQMMTRKKRRNNFNLLYLQRNYLYPNTPLR